MVRIRFRRVGARNQPSFRIVAADRESPRDGRFLEVIGSYNPRTNPSTLKVDEARLFHWMSHGAQPSDSVMQTLQSVGTWERWERFKGGESLEVLIQEAEAAMPEGDPRTRRDDLIGQRSKKRRRHVDAEPKAEAEVDEAKAGADKAEADEPVEDEAGEAAPAEAEKSAEAEKPAEAEADEGAKAEAEEAEVEESAKGAAEEEVEAEADEGSEAEEPTESDKVDEAEAEESAEEEGSE